MRLSRWLMVSNIRPQSLLVAPFLICVLGYTSISQLVWKTSVWVIDHWVIDQLWLFAPCFKSSFPFYSVFFSWSLWILSLDWQHFLSSYSMSHINETAEKNFNLLPSHGLLLLGLHWNAVQCGAWTFQRQKKCLHCRMTWDWSFTVFSVLSLDLSGECKSTHWGGHVTSVDTARGLVFYRSVCTCASFWIHACFFCSISSQFCPVVE